jgi:hypothetical protein
MIREHWPKNTWPTDIWSTDTHYKNIPMTNELLK